jgi:hypothetical protein
MTDEQQWKEVEEVLKKASQALVLHYKIQRICSIIICLIVLLLLLSSILCHASELCNPKTDHYRVMKATTNGGKVYYEVMRCRVGGWQRSNSGDVYEDWPLKFSYTWYVECSSNERALRNIDNCTYKTQEDAEIFYGVLEYKRQDVWKQQQIRDREEYLNKVKKWERVK